MVTPARSYLRPQRVRTLLCLARITDFGISEERFPQVIALQQRLNREGYGEELGPQEIKLVADIWEGVKAQVRDRRTGYEPLERVLRRWWREDDG